ncbi:CoA-acylating methylmalonate-semialdehyde dehydrogenase [Gammaproteobacteria bacterium]|nr:CoA-acylating methylmalonate-semialdehyde dehydrogenase [Gammaproteobacteria bacterium]
MQNLTHFINGQHSQESDKKLIVENPATREIIGHVSLASEKETNEAVNVAHKALNNWSATPANKRTQILFKFKQAVEANKNNLAKLLTTEHGKTLEDSMGEVQRGIEVIDFACGIPHLLKGEYTDNVGSGVDSWSIFQPLGVVAGITPFNFPIMVPLWMIPIAIASGNTFILKPSEKDPSGPLKLAELLSDSGLPDGVLNVINGDKVAVDTLLTNKLVQAISFVGSTPVAEKIYQTGCQHGKRVQALGGAKNHMIVMPDADLDQAVNSIIGSAYGSAGERCMAISVVVAVGGVADEIINKLIPKIKEIKIGNGLDKDTEMGPIISQTQLEKIKNYIQKGIDSGAKLIIDGRTIKTKDNTKGFFIGGSLFDFVTEEMSIYQEEIFGPVLCIVRAPDYKSALNLINKHEFGNGTAIFTRDGDSARQFSQDVQIGMVGINVPIPVPMAFHSFGGWKRSLFGPLNMHGEDGVRFYTKRKTITSRWPTGIRENPEFVIPTMK